MARTVSAPAPSISETIRQKGDRSGELLQASLAGPAAAPFRLGSDSARDLECLTQAVYYEARGEGRAGQAAVAQVVLNRVRHRAFPNSVCAVVFQGCQFSFSCNGSMRANREGAAWNRARRIAQDALDGAVMASVGNATHFHTIHVAPNWTNLRRVGQIGLHVFYRFGGRNGRAGAFDREPAPSRDTELVYARYVPPAEEPKVYMMGAMIQPKPEVAATTSAPGMGGPAGKPQEPASAPAAARTVAVATPAKPGAKTAATATPAKPAAKPAATAPEAAAKPAAMEVKASLDAPVRTSGTTSATAS